MRSLLFAVLHGVTAVLALGGWGSAMAQDTPPHAEGREVIAGVLRSWPPQYSLDEQGRPIGFAIDVMDEVARRAGIRVTYRIYDDFPPLMEAVLQGEIDISPNIGITPDRARDFDFTSPVETFVVSMFVRTDSTDIESLADLAGRRVAAVEYNVGVKLMEQRPDIELVTYRELETALFALLSGKVDGFVYPRSIIEGIAERIGVGDEIRTLGEPLSEVKRGIQVRKGQLELLAVLNAAVENFVGTKAYQEIYVKWYGNPSPPRIDMRLLWAASALIVLLVSALVAWRYFSVIRLNRDLQQSIDQRELTEKALRESQALFEHAARITGLGYWKWDTKNDRCLIASEQLADIHGLTIEEYMEQRGSNEAILQYVHPDDREIFRRHAANMTGSEIEFRIFDAKGKLRYLREISMPELSSDLESVEFGTVQDITEQKQAEEELRRSAEHLANAQRMARLGSWDWEAANDQLSWSSNLYRLIGLEPGSIAPSYKLFINAVHPDDRTRVHEAARRAVNGLEPYALDYRVCLPRNEERVLHEERSITFDDAGQLVRASGVVQDMTEHSRLEEQLRQAQKMEAVGQLTGGIAHDFNNLLAIIIGNLELMDEALDENDPLRANLAPILRAGNRGAELTQRLLAFSRRQMLDPKPTNINKLVRSMTGLLSRTLGETIEVETSLSGSLWTTSIDRGQLENALVNLAVNARDAMPNGGKLTIATANAEVDDDYAAAQIDVAPGQYVMLSVSDTGMGMSPEVTRHVFEPFFTTKEQGKGSGLGLSMVYGFVKQSGGQVTIYSEVGQGTSIKLYLPRSAMEKEKPKASTRDITMPASQGETILVVEDDADVRTLTVTLLGDLGYQVLEAGTAQSALSLLNRDTRIILLLTDVVLPGGMSGRNLAEQAQQCQPGLRVLFMSGYTENAITHHGRLDEGVQLLSKPFRKSDLARKIREVLESDQQWLL